MAEGNGSGRLDRIEASLEATTTRLNQLTEKFHLMVDYHDAEFKQLMTWQVLMQDRFEKQFAIQEAEQKRLNRLSETSDKRIGELVSGIGALIRSDASNSGTHTLSLATSGATSCRLPLSAGPAVARICGEMVTGATQGAARRPAVLCNAAHAFRR